MSNSPVICVIGAMECEIKRFINIIKDAVEIKHGELIFYKGIYNNKTLIIAKSGVGKVAGAVCTQILIDKFNPDYIINTGVAGGLKNNMQIGDVVIANRLVQHDFDATALGYAKGYICNGINPNEPTYFYPDSNLIEKFKNAIANQSLNLKFHEGTIASGDIFIGTNEKKKEIVNLFDAAAVEMEGASIAYTALINKVPFIIIRAISDLADNSSLDKYSFTEEDAAEISSKTVETFLKANFL